MGGKRAPNRLGQDGHPVLAPLPAPKEDLSPPEIDVLHPQGHRLMEPEAGAIEQGAKEMVEPRELVEYHLHLGAAQHDRQPRRSSGAEDRTEIAEWATKHIPVEKEKRAQGLPLGRGRHPLIGGEVGEEGGDVHLGELTGMAEAVKPNEATRPGHIGCLGSGTLVGGAKRWAKAPRELGRRGGGCGANGHMTDIAEEERKGKSGKTRAAPGAHDTGPADLRSSLAATGTPVG